MDNIDDNTMKMLTALSEQQGNAGAEQMFMQLLMGAMQPKEDPDAQIRELMAQSVLNDPNGPDFDLVRQIMNPKSNLDEITPKLSGQLGGGEVDAALENERLTKMQDLIASGDTNRARQFEGLTPDQYSQYKDIKAPNVGLFDRSNSANMTGRIKQAQQDLGMTGSSFLDRLSNGTKNPFKIASVLGDVLTGGGVKRKKQESFLDSLGY